MEDSLRITAEKPRLWHESQSLRDDIITNKLGDGWQMVRISTDNINKNITRLIPAIKSLLKYRREIRG